MSHLDSVLPCQFGNPQSHVGTGQQQAALHMTLKGVTLRFAVLTRRVSVKLPFLSVQQRHNGGMLFTMQQSAEVLMLPRHLYTPSGPKRGDRTDAISLPPMARRASCFSCVHSESRSVSAEPDLRCTGNQQRHQQDGRAKQVASQSGDGGPGCSETMAICGRSFIRLRPEPHQN